MWLVLLLLMALEAVPVELGKLSMPRLVVAVVVEPRELSAAELVCLQKSTDGMSFIGVDTSAALRSETLSALRSETLSGLGAASPSWSDVRSALTDAAPFPPSLGPKSKRSFFSDFWLLLFFMTPPGTLPALTRGAPGRRLSTRPKLRACLAGLASGGSSPERRIVTTTFVLAPSSCTIPSTLLSPFTEKMISPPVNCRQSSLAWEMASWRGEPRVMPPTKTCWLPGSIWSSATQTSKPHCLTGIWERIFTTYSARASPEVRTRSRLPVTVTFTAAPPASAFLLRCLPASPAEAVQPIIVAAAARSRG
mmetsp:Transcript_63392/g.151302  ORF Transcript_63392/g.151302 Transcript_63392/m.151302 type:complete len:308 (-) Transcript_63392:8-931(-)